MTDVLAYSSGAHETQDDERALLAKLDAARLQLAAPFAPARVDLVASVAETLLGRDGQPLPGLPPISPSGPAAPRS